MGAGTCPRENAIVVSLSYHTAENDHPDAWAYVLPYEGAHIVVFWDRIQQKMPVGRAQILLAHVLVHEITHILQGVSRHSDTGVMKARWSDEDIPNDEEAFELYTVRRHDHSSRNGDPLPFHGQPRKVIWWRYSNRHMTPERLEQVQELYRAALERDASGRPALIAQADPDLRREVRKTAA